MNRLALLLLMPLSACGWASPEDMNAQEEGADPAAEALAAANLLAADEAQDPAVLKDLWVDAIVLSQASFGLPLEPGRSVGAAPLKKKLSHSASLAR